MIALYMLGSIYVLWVFYLAVMNLKRARDNNALTKTAYWLGMPIFLLGYAIDIAVNIFVLPIIFLELPRETLVTSRLKRLIKTTGWRSNLAKWFCKNLLDAFDPSGCHCKE
jgi:hypothetical protein